MRQRFVIAGLVAAFAVSLLSFAAVLRAQHADSVHSRLLVCRATNASSQTLRSVLVLARRSSRPGPATTRFYAHALARVRLVDCSTIR